MTAAVEMFPLSPQVIQQRGAFDLSPDTRVNFTRSWEVRSRDRVPTVRASNEPSRGFHNHREGLDALVALNRVSEIVILT